MNNRDVRYAYTTLVSFLQKQFDQKKAMSDAVGGYFDVVGSMERDILIQYGLPPDGYAIDVGCGSGRLALPLSRYLNGQYLGTDVVPDLVDYARQLVNRPDWRFEVTEGFKIPEADDQADVVCFFSVFTHMLHEHSYRYLMEAKRVLKPGGTIIFSFLEFAIARHWEQFQWNIPQNDLPLNMFIGRDAIHAWVEHLDLECIALEDGDKPHIKLSEPVFFDGKQMEHEGYLGQSLCVLARKG